MTPESSEGREADRVATGPEEAREASEGSEGAADGSSAAPDDPPPSEQGRHEAGPYDWDAEARGEAVSRRRSPGPAEARPDSEASPSRLRVPADRARGPVRRPRLGDPPRPEQDASASGPSPGEGSARRDGPGTPAAARRAAPPPREEAERREEMPPREEAERRGDIDEDTRPVPTPPSEGGEVAAGATGAGPAAPPRAPVPPAPAPSTPAPPTRERPSTPGRPEIVPPEEPGPRQARRAETRAERAMRPEWHATLARVGVLGIFKISLAVALAVFAVTLGLGVLLWTLLGAAGVIENLESFLGELLGYEDFEFLGWRIFQVFLLLGLVWAMLTAVAAAVLAFFYNQISRLLGGIDATFEEG